MSDENAATAKKRKPIEIYRRTDAKDYGEHDILTTEDVSPAIAQGLTDLVAADAAGQAVKLVFAAPGCNLTHVWFKSGYPLPPHSHTGDCLYYILAGSITMGRDTLGPGDGFFVGSDVPYSYTPGPEGVEVLEFRHTDYLNIRFAAKTPEAWEKIVSKLHERKADWVDEVPPTQTHLVHS